MKNIQSTRLLPALLASVCVLFLAAAPLTAQDANTPPAAGTNALAEAPDSATAPEATQGEATKAAKATIDRRAVVVIGNNAELKANESADCVVVIGGSAKIHGKVNGAVVSIGGNAEIDGEVRDPVVAVLGNIRTGQGANLHDNAVAILGDIAVGSGATVNGDAVTVGGHLEIASGGAVKGSSPEFVINLLWLKQWLLDCAFKLRPLGLHAGWVPWAVAGAFLLFYLLVAAAFPRPVQLCVDTLHERPASSLVLGILTYLLAPVISLILIATGVGVFVLPFFALALFAGAVIGKVALIEWMGLRIGQQSGITLLQRPLMAFVVGAIILTLFYLIWVVGFLAYLLFSVWGLGIAVTAVISTMRRRPAVAMPPEPPAPAPAFAAHPSATSAREAETERQRGMEGAAAGFAPEAPAEPRSTMSMPVPPPPPLPEALSYPRAGFWDRMGAAFLDVVLLGIIGILVHGVPWVFLVALAYFAGMWTWKGTTIGGIVLGLKVVRVDGQPLTFTVALVRALAAAFSIVVLFLGFLWIAWDREKQGWHDLIAGTAVVRLPRGTPLLCV